MKSKLTLILVLVVITLSAGITRDAKAGSDDPKTYITYMPVVFCNNGTTYNYPIFETPQNGQTLDFNSDWYFRVRPMTNAGGYLWGFFQDGEAVWENLTNEGVLSGNEYTIYVGSDAHSRFTPGSVEVWVRAWVNGAWTEPSVLTVNVQ